MKWTLYTILGLACLLAIWCGVMFFLLFILWGFSSHELSAGEKAFTTVITGLTWIGILSAPVIPYLYIRRMRKKAALEHEQVTRQRIAESKVAKKRKG